MGLEKPAVTFHTNVPEVERSARYNADKHTLDKQHFETVLVGQKEKDVYAELFVRGGAQIADHLEALGVPRAVVEKRFDEMRLRVGTAQTAYVPMLDAVTIRHDELQEFLKQGDAPRVVRHEIVHGLTQHKMFFEEAGGTTRSGFCVGRFGGRGYIVLGYMLNELFVDAVASRADETERPSERAEIFNKMMGCISRAVGQSEDEVYKAFVNVGLYGWGVKPFGKELKHWVRTAYGPLGMSLMLRLAWPQGIETEQDLGRALRQNKTMQFLHSPPADEVERNSRAALLLEQRMY